MIAADMKESKNTQFSKAEEVLKGILLIEHIPFTFALPLVKSMSLS